MTDSEKTFSIKVGDDKERVSRLFNPFAVTHGLTPAQQRLEEWRCRCGEGSVRIVFINGRVESMDFSDPPVT